MKGFAVPLTDPWSERTPSGPMAWRIAAIR